MSEQASMPYPEHPKPHASAVGLLCPYHSCGNCQYVGREINFGGSCPACAGNIGGALATWPMIQWIHAADDIGFLYQNGKLELLTIAIASYYEGVLHSFLYDALTLIHPPTRMMDCERPDVADSGDRFVAEQQEARRRYQLIEELFRKHRSWGRRHKDLCVAIFKSAFDDLARKHVSSAEQFITNRDNIHKWRNLILHRGVPLKEAWPEHVQKAAPDIGLRFVRECWDVFRLLNNELIHKPRWASKQVGRTQ